MQIALSLIKPSPRPVRTSWDEEKLEELAQSIKEQGLIVPVKVRPLNGVKYCTYHKWAAFSDEYEPDCIGCDAVREKYHPAFEIVYGHRRVEAARRAGHESVETVVEEVDEFPAHVQAAIENKVREDMSAFDFAKALKWQMDTGQLSQRKVGAKYGISPSTVSNYLALLELAEVPPANITAEHLKMANAGASGDKSIVQAVLTKAATEELSKRQTRRVAESVAAAPSEEAKKKLLDWEYSPTIHDPELIKSRAKEYGAHDPMYREPTLRHDQPWRETPEVAAAVTGIIEGAKRWQTLIQEVRKMVEIGKMSPEARRFAAHRVRQLADMLAEWARELEG